MPTKTIITPFLLPSGTPATGLVSASINIRDADSGELLVNTASLEEVGDGFYRYIYTDYTSSINYAIRFDGGSNTLGSGRYTFTANDHYSEDIWSQDMTVVDSDIIPSGSVTPVSSSGQMLNFVKDIEGGRWKIDTGTNKMTFFKDDNTTVVAVYDLFDSGGTPASIDVFERKKT